jgi:hypothetical protein
MLKPINRTGNSKCSSLAGKKIRNRQFFPLQERSIFKLNQLVTINIIKMSGSIDLAIIK